MVFYYTINFNFDPLIFDGTKIINLDVPNAVTTYSQQPSENLFNGSQQQNQSSGGNR